MRFKTLISRLKLQKEPVRIILHEMNGKRYASVMRTNFGGVKWTRRFEVINEVNSRNEPIEFKSKMIKIEKK